MPVTFFGLDHLLFLPAAGLRIGSQSDAWAWAEGRYWSTRYSVHLKHYSGGFYASVTEPVGRGAAIRLASVVSEDLTVDVSSVPSCCGISYG